MERLIFFGLLKFFSLTNAESFQEISYEPDTPIYNLIYSEKYQNPLQTAPTVNKDLATFKEIYDNDVLGLIEPPIEEISSFQQFRNILYNIKLALYDCKFHRESLFPYIVIFLTLVSGPPPKRLNMVYQNQHCVS